VALGPGAFELAARRWASYPVMTLPDGEDPLGFRWPIAGFAVLVHEAGVFDTDRLERLVAALLRDGATLVVPLRQALLDAVPPRSWCSYRPRDLSELYADPEVTHG
jgi:hypothetical protein